jgi:hypothetical protein
MYRWFVAAAVAATLSIVYLPAGGQPAQDHKAQSRPAQKEPGEERNEPLNPPPYESITYITPGLDGNHLVAGRGTFPHVGTFDLKLDGRPLWLLASHRDDVPVWIAVLEDGAVRAFEMGDEGLRSVGSRGERLEPGAPPVLVADDAAFGLLDAGLYLGNHLTHPVLFDGQANFAAVGPGGDLFLGGEPTVSRHRLNALPDTRLLLDGEEHLLFLSDPTGSYTHGILGDRLEAKTVTLLSLKGGAQIQRKIELHGDLVVEGLSPLWADLVGDGEKEIIVTASDATGGARIVVYDSRGRLLAEGPSIGRGFRWLHQIAVAPFGPAAELELATVRTPHIGGIVQFYRWAEGGLEMVAERGGYSSHVIGSRNLEMALAGDLAGDGTIELVVPNQRRNALAGLKRTETGVEEAWRLSVGGTISTNLASVVSPAGIISIGAGREDGSLRVWISDTNR